MTTLPETAGHFFGRQSRFLAAAGFEVHTISSPNDGRIPACFEPQGLKHEVWMTREITPVRDLIALVRLYRLLRRLRPRIVHTHTPKAGLLGMMAAALARVPIRIYTVNGLPILTRSGVGRFLLASAEWVSCNLATEVLCVSRSVRRFITAHGFCRGPKARVLGDGGSHGVNAREFDPVACGLPDRVQVRRRYGIPEDALVIGYVGRIVPDKGIYELAGAWNLLREEFPDLHLLLCGHAEPEYPVSASLIERLRSDARVHILGLVTEMPPIYAAIDIAVLPTHREGLPNVALECGAMQVPIVASRVVGCVDAIRDGVTGLLTEPRDAQALASALRSLVQSRESRERMGTAARRFVCDRFADTRISELLAQEYRRLLLGSPGVRPQDCLEIDRSCIADH